ncbi:hypothetical protein HPB47_013495 [Ixodes persulcatus]|uniref:Uncharacterized protein n=1 Tax=Ixodes persulcatus TaxID=34615 RepID=A0AC60QZR5_IXOPE|nr:hypothetical protein HPB47_013495 [Ixodes persulcatus]
MGFEKSKFGGGGILLTSALPQLCSSRDNLRHDCAGYHVLSAGCSPTLARYFSDNQPMFKENQPQPDKLGKLVLESESTVYEFHVVADRPDWVFATNGFYVPETPTLSEGGHVKFRATEFEAGKECYFTMSKSAGDKANEVKCVLPKPTAGGKKEEIFTVVTMYENHVAVQTDTGLKKAIKHSFKTSALFGVFDMTLVDISFKTGLY